jgi:hypothetical protein
MSMAELDNNHHHLPFFLAAVLFGLLLVCGSADAENIPNKTGPAGTCPLANDAGFRDLLKMKYVRYAETARQDMDEDNLVMNGGASADDFFMNGRRKYVSLAGKGGNDFYFLPIMGSHLKIRETPAKGELNTLVVTDMMDPAREPPSIMRTGNNLMIWREQSDVPGNITIKNWFGSDAASQAPVSCFVFLPDLKIYGPDDIAGWLRRYDDIIARRKAAPPQVMHVPMAQIYPKPASPIPPQRRPRAELPRNIFGPLPTNIAVESIGVYQSDAPLENATDAEGENHGTVTVNIFKYDVPIVLVLTSYEPVHWIINSSKASTIKGIILCGYHKQTIQSNLPGLPMRNLSGADSPMPVVYPYNAELQASLAAKFSIMTSLPAGNVRHHSAPRASVFDVR